MSRRQIGIAHLTLLSSSPPELIDIAGAVGFDFVGIRVHAVTSAERRFPMHVGSSMLAETVARLRDVTTVVRDIEFLPLKPNTRREHWRPILESGAALGASALTVAGADPDRSRLIDTLASLTEDAAEHGIRPLLESISYQPVRSVRDAASIARATGAGLMIDPLHLQRAGDPPDLLDDIEEDLIPVLQLCDAPASPPAGTGMELASSLQREARQARLIPGEGSLDLDGLLRRAPTLTPVSVEVPHAQRQARTSPRRWASRNLDGARRVLSAVDRAGTVSAREV